MFLEPTTASKLVSDIKRCTKVRDLECGKKLHALALASGINAAPNVSPALITMYSRCSSMSLARQVFDGMLERDTATWNSIIMGYVANGDYFKAFEVFSRMDRQPDAFTYVAALKACGGLAKDSNRELFLEKGIAIHKQLRELGSGTNIIVETSLIYMYRRCGSMKHAKEVFDGMNRKNVITWSSLILGYAENGDCRPGIEAFERMDCEPDSFTFVAVLKACGGLAVENKSEKQLCFEKGTAVHEQVRTRGLDKETIVATALLDMYCKCGFLHDARKVFDGMKDRSFVTWTSLMMGYVDNGESLEGLELFASMDCEPNYVTYIAVLKAYGALASDKKAEKKKLWLERTVGLHNQLLHRRLASNTILANTLIDVYMKCGCEDRAREVFEAVETKSVVTWTSLILGYVAHGHSSSALEVFSRMDCEPNSVTYVAVLKACGALASEGVVEKQVCLERGLAVHQQVKARRLESEVAVAATLVDMYGKCGCMEMAEQVFQTMKHRQAVTWTSLILGYVENGRSFEALRTFTSMDCEPDSLTYVALLKACGSLSARLEGRGIHAEVCRLGLERDEVMASSLMDFYVKCGYVERAEVVFNSMNRPSVVPWNTLIAGYSSCGEPREAFALGMEMQEGGVEMDDISFTSILTSCSHAGLVDEGKVYFDIVLKKGVRATVEQYNCMVDMLGRANRLEEALALIDAMPVKANQVTWTSLLDSCRKWKNVRVGKAAFQGLVAVKQQRVEN